MTLRKICTVFGLAALLALAPLSPASADPDGDTGHKPSVSIIINEDKVDDKSGTTADTNAANHETTGGETDAGADAGTGTGSNDDGATGDQDLVAPKLLLTLGSKEALLDGVPHQLEIPPEVVQQSTFLPVRFVVEKVLGAAVQWDAATRGITITKGETRVELTLEQGQAVVNGQEVVLGSPPFAREGRTLVPLRFLAENMGLPVEYNAVDKTIVIMEIEEDPDAPAPVNLPPVITSVGLQSDVIKMGEVPSYSYTYDNEPGEPIWEEEWSCQLVGDTKVVTGKPRVFYQPGQYVLSLRIKDAVGNWSETVTTRFTVSQEKVMSEMAFKFSQPVNGELFENADADNFNFLPSNKNVTFARSGPVLHMSNSPEVVNGPGLLYRSEANGTFRLFYHHLNGASEKQYLYVIAANNGQFPVTLKTLKSGVGGPVNDYMNLGQVVAMRYFSSQPGQPITINPGQKVILNDGLRHLNKGEAVTGMQDFQVDGMITISVVMGPEKGPEPEPEPEPAPETGLEQESDPDTDQDQPLAPDTNPEADENQDTDPAVAPVKTPAQILQEKIDYLLSLPALPRHPQQVRGVFEEADCLVQIQVNSQGVEKITLGKEDPGFDFWTEGVDPLTGDRIKSFGNYGVVYQLQVTAPTKTGLLLNPRGSIFKGAFVAPDGQVYKAPAVTHFTGLQKAAVLGVLQANQTGRFIYTAPSGSDTPVVIALIPEQFWD